jgi:hypothetical protein
MTKQKNGLPLPTSLRFGICQQFKILLSRGQWLVIAAKTSSSRDTSCDLDHPLDRLSVQGISLYASIVPSAI